MANQQLAWRVTSRSCCNRIGLNIARSFPAEILSFGQGSYIHFLFFYVACLPRSTMLH